MKWNPASFSSSSVLPFFPLPFDVASFLSNRSPLSKSIFLGIVSLSFDEESWHKRYMYVNFLQTVEAVALDIPCK